MLLTTGILILIQYAALDSHAATVRLRVEFAPQANSKRTRSGNTPQVVLWLSPKLASGEASSASPGHFRMEQKGKSFRPHLLVVALGSYVEFPNLDPFFHNVFSQFNGKRFDLGLYEAGSTKTVRFDHEGASYLFCNIHSQMAGVIVTLATPYYAIAEREGVVTIHDVPTGDYRLHAWAEGVDANQLNHLDRPVHVTAEDIDAGTIRLPRPDIAPPHKNKFGEDYPPERTPEYP